MAKGMRKGNNEPQIIDFVAIRISQHIDNRSIDPSNSLPAGATLQR
jgi:hypothetical protein